MRGSHTGKPLTVSRRIRILKIIHVPIIIWAAWCVIILIIIPIPPRIHLTTPHTLTAVRAPQTARRTAMHSPQVLRETWSKNVLTCRTLVKLATFIIVMHENCGNDQTKDNEWDTVDSKAECGTKKCSTDNATHTADKDNQEEGKNPFQNSPEHSILVFSYPTHLYSKLHSEQCDYTLHRLLGKFLLYRSPTNYQLMMMSTVRSC